MMSIIPGAYLNATVSIGVDAGGSITWVGTGFYILKNHGEPGVGTPYLVTNRHVLEGKERIIVRMVSQDNGVLINVPALVANNGTPLYLVHDNPAIDIAVLELSAEFIKSNNLAYYAFDIDYDSMQSRELRNEGFDEGSLIYMLGFPLGLVNEGSPMPICRLGCVARMDESQISETGNFLVDVQNFPGNSGSPIVSRPEILAVGGTGSLSRCVLIGITHSYIPYRVPLLDAQTGRTVEVREENSGLANVHPVEFIREIINQVSSKSVDSDYQEAGTEDSNPTVPEIYSDQERDVENV